MRDHVEDSNPTYLFKAAETLDIPDYVLGAPTTAKADVEGLPDRAFANPSDRLFPVNTKEAAVMSALCFYGKGYRDSAIESNLKKAAGAHGILDLMSQIEGVFNLKVKSASSDMPKFALAIEDGDSTRYFYPTQTEVELTQSARNLTKDAHADALPLSFVRTAAQEMCKRAGELGLEPKKHLPSAVVNLGEDRIPNFEVAKTAADRRKEFCGVDDEGYNLMCSAVEGAKEAHFNGEDIEDFVEIFRMVDNAHHVKYSALIKDPYQAFFSGELREDVEKFANTIVFVADAPIPTEVMSSLKDEDIESNFRAEVADTIKIARDCSIGDAPQATQGLAGMSEHNSKTLLNLLLATAGT